MSEGRDGHGRYELFEQFLVRITGVPFDALEGLATSGTARAARDVLALEQRVQEAGVALLAASRAKGETNDKLKRRVEELKPVGATGLGDADQRYEEARAAYQTARDALLPLLERELDQARTNLRKESAQHLPGFTVFTAELGDPELFGPRLTGALPPLNAKERQRERTYLMYLQRVAAKNDTIAAYGPTAWGRIERRDGAPAFAIDPQPGIAGRDVYLEKWVVNAVLAGINKDAEARPELTPRLHHAGRLESDREGAPAGERFVRLDTGAVTPLSPAQRAVVGRIDGATPAHAIGDLSVLDELVAQGVVLWEQTTVMLIAHRLEVVRDDVARWRPGAVRERWLGVIDGLLDVQRAFAATTDVEARKELMAKGAELAHALGAQAKDTSRTALYRGASALSEDCVRESNARLGADIARVVEEDAAPWMDLWRDAYSHLAHRLAAGLRPLVASAPKTDGKVLLPAFLAHAASKGCPIQANGMLDLAAPAVDEVRAAFTAALAGKPDDAEEWVLSERECHVVRNQLGTKPFDEFTLPAVDFMIGAPSVDAVNADAVNAGRAQVIVGELHAPIVTLQHCFSWANPDPARFADGLRACLGEQPWSQMFHYGNVRVQATCHTSVDFHKAMPGRFRIASLERGLPSWPSVRASDVEVYVDDESGDVRTRLAADGTILGSFARDWFLVWIAFHPFVFYRAPYLPRLRIGRCVVQRRTWLVERHELGDGRFEGTDPGLVLAVERLRARRGMPRWVFVRPVPTYFAKTLTGKDKDHKPVCVDLESYFSNEVLASWARKYPLLEVTEMLPNPDNLCWQERTGRYTFELRALVVPKGQGGGR